MPTSFELRTPTFRQSVRDHKRSRPSGIAMMAATAAGLPIQNSLLANPWFRAKVVHLGEYKCFDNLFVLVDC